MSGIFISYRQQDTAAAAGRLHDRLAAHFGPTQIIRDIGTFNPDVDFGRHIDQTVRSCDAFVALVGARWLLDRNPPGKRPIGIPRDWVLKEIEAALAAPDVLVVPVLVEDAALPDPLALPYSIRTLAERRALRLTDERWDDDVQQLIEALEEVVEAHTGPGRAAGHGLPPAPPPPPPPEAPRPRRRFRR